MFQKRSGEVVKRFEVNIVSHREGDNLILDEHFLYSDGTRQRRVWTLTPEGRAGAGARMTWWASPRSGRWQYLHWRYRLNLPVDGSTYEMSMDDWMYQMDEDTLINRTACPSSGLKSAR
jgi:hypothetical protein